MVDPTVKHRIISRQSLGGKASAIIFRKKALDGYYNSPNICRNCGNIIKVESGQKVSEVKRKKFCNKSCAAIFNNKDRKQENKPNLSKEEVKILRINRILDSWKLITKKELFDKCKDYFSARSTITKYAKNAVKYFNFEKICINCGYSNHVEVCHLKSVSSFSDDATIYDINNINNLVLLCPNCHWELDHGFLKLRGREEVSRHPHKLETGSSILPPET